MLRGLVLHANLISFQIRIGTMPDGNKLDFVAREIDDRDVPRANLVLGQLRARNLPNCSVTAMEEAVSLCIRLSSSFFSRYITRSATIARTPPEDFVCMVKALAIDLYGPFNGHRKRRTTATSRRRPNSCGARRPPPSAAR